MTSQFRFPLVEYHDADAQVQRLYDEVMHHMGVPFVPNWFKCQGSNPALLTGNWAKVQATLLTGSVPRALKEAILYNISKERSNTYCQVAHGMMADMLGTELSDKANFQLTAHLDNETLEPRFRTAIRIATRAALAPESITDADFEELHTMGFSVSEIQEVMAQVDLVNMLNTIAELAGIELDAELTANPAPRA